MSLASEARKEADQFFERLGDEARKLIGDAIEFRRRNPCYFAKVRRNMARKFRERKRFRWFNELRARTQDRLAERYESRCEAEQSLLASQCGICSKNAP